MTALLWYGMTTLILQFRSAVCGPVRTFICSAMMRCFFFFFFLCYFFFLFFPFLVVISSHYPLIFHVDDSHDDWNGAVFSCSWFCFVFFFLPSLDETRKALRFADGRASLSMCFLWASLVSLSRSGT